MDELDNISMSDSEDTFETDVEEDADDVMESDDDNFSDDEDDEDMNVDIPDEEE